MFPPLRSSLPRVRRHPPLLPRLLLPPLQPPLQPPRQPPRPPLRLPRKWLSPTFKVRMHARLTTQGVTGRIDS